MFDEINFKWGETATIGKLLRPNEFEHCSSLVEVGLSDESPDDSYTIVIMTNITITGRSY